MDRTRLKRWVGWALSPSRMAAKARIDRGEIGSARQLRQWNFAFQAITAEICCISIADRLLGWHLPSLLYVAAGVYAFGRVNELVVAFFRDALDRLEGKEPRIRLEKSERITLLGIGYVETIAQFGLIHLAGQALSTDCAYKPPLRDAFDAVYFSAVTITTTGFGDIAPLDPLPRLATMYEAVIGIVFLALALGSYLSFTVKPEAASDGKTGVETGEASPP